MDTAGLSRSPWVLLLLYTVVGAFGGGLQPIVVVEWFRPMIMLQFLHRSKFCLNGPLRFLGTLLLATLAQAVSFTIANAGAFKDPDWSVTGVLTVFIITIICSFILVPIAYGGYTAYHLRFEEVSLSKPLVFATLWTAVWGLAASYFPIGSYSHPAYSQSDIQPLVLTASVFGIDGLCFLMAWASSLVHEVLVMRDQTVKQRRLASDDSAPGVDDAAAGAADSADVETARGDYRLLGDRLDNGKPLTVHLKAFAITVLVALAYGSSLRQFDSGHFYQRNIEDIARPTFGASCIVGAFEQEAGLQRLFRDTSARITAGDDIIIWSETAALVMGDKEEADLIARISSMAVMGSLARGAGASGPYIGITYLKKLNITQPKPKLSLFRNHIKKPRVSGFASEGLPAVKSGDSAVTSKDSLPVKSEFISAVTSGSQAVKSQPLLEDDFAFKAINTFVFIGPTGSVLFAYNKSHPVPIIEDEVVAGPEVLEVVDTPYGRVGAAICFDLDFPEFVRQAGQKRVALLLQPSWTWGPLPAIDFEGDGFRAVENGFLWFRCSSNGMSGAIDHQYNKLLYRETLNSGVVTARLPIDGHHTTPYVLFGFTFKYIVQAFACLYLMLALLPLRWVNWILLRLPRWAFRYVTGYEVDELRRSS